MKGSTNRYVRQPRTGDFLETGRHGVVEVKTVRLRGRVLEVVDRDGRSWTVERADAGCWYRAATEVHRS